MEVYVCNVYDSIPQLHTCIIYNRHCPLRICLLKLIHAAGSIIPTDSPGNNAGAFDHFFTDTP